ncbi:MAG: YeeE/YedE family protein [Flavobacterium sp.]|nr:YeeE/YedE family protein [Flavobacterium sp.]
MNYIKYCLVGFIFGIVLTKSEAISWYRIIEMFEFQSFHMFGIIISAVVTGTLGIQLFKKYQIKSIDNEVIKVADKEKGTFRYWIGGLFFGLGWALVGCCPGPIFILIGAGFLPAVVILIGALLGTFVYGVFKEKLPH